MTRLMLRFWTQCAPVRLCSIHTLHSSFVIQTVTPLVRAAMGKELRHKAVFHCGTTKELFESLDACGIPKAAVPACRGGDLEPRGITWLYEQGNTNDEPP
mmetsp:Transcript_2498/g.3679  ORF Transcript_2498/g.3679 Transcript_2498/m.3679 type:complete len:100 (-) Transcript_2498:182-481(-)|eukprot:CAMPEP_0118696836 /NCGR_PEP_ID=MMETSP0800-20121206/14105_1 /TAXON_ID=210618 ORGANISM="Striatella unipunctata, Strain CCMP2910" /NCGR_SAMPLE_ID=MMETSP0800 /ASSEMBLY_ACC=CAM_ASM_000638 /LENGTH=99 /DNA_ID=CAMNT_0006596067 /DNA_START=274 /DNA_END=573 /DNA_ORIENTATION=+